MGNDWRHFPEIKATCPACGRPAHLGRCRKSREYYWLHDDIEDYPLNHEGQAEPCFVEPELAALLRECGDPDAMARLLATWKSRPVRCVETGEVFESIEAAAEHAGVSASSLSGALRKGARSRGCHWERAD